MVGSQGGFGVERFPKGNSGLVLKYLNKDRGILVQDYLPEIEQGELCAICFVPI